MAYSKLFPLIPVVLCSISTYSIDNYNALSWRDTQKVSPGWTINTPNYGYVSPSTYANGDIICHTDATPGKLSVKVKAGDILHLQWSHWLPTHHGPMMHYLANAGADFASVDKFKLKWNKIDQLGMIDPDHSWNMSATQPAGYYAADQLIVQGGRWDFQVPEAIAKGNYVLRAETIAIHYSMLKDGTQHYPQCINIEVTEGGSDHLYGGVIGTQLYNPNEPGIGIFNVFSTHPVLSNYSIPGPPIHECGQKGYNQTPRFGSAPKWNGPDSAEPFGLGNDFYPVGKIGVDAPNGETSGNSPAAETTTSATTAATTAATTTASATEENSKTTAPAIKTSAKSVPHVEVRSSWTPHSFIGTNATASATGTYPTATPVPVYGTPVENSGKQNTDGDVKHPGSGYTDSDHTNGKTQDSTAGGTHNYSSGSTTDSEHQCSEACHHDSNGGHHTGGDNTSTPSSAAGGNHPTSTSNPTSHNDNSGSDNYSTTGGSSTSQDSLTNSNPISHSGNSGSGTSAHSLIDNSTPDTCAKPAPAKVDSSATPTDESTVAQLLDIIDLCLKKLKAKLTNKLRRHARDILHARV